MTDKGNGDGTEYDIPMTLILTLVTPTFAIQVSDRRVSYVDGRIYDDEANKTAVVAAADGVLVLSYTGPAYLDGAPTDHWLAEQVSNQELPLQFGSIVSMGASGRFEGVGPILERVKHRCTAQYSKSGLTERMRIVFAGIQWSKNIAVSAWDAPRARLVGGEIQNSSTIPGGFTLAWMDRRSFVPEISGGVRRRRLFHLGHAPDVWLSADELDALCNDIKTAGSIDECEDLLVETIRAVATRPAVTRVGADCMSVLIVNNRQFPWVRIRFRPQLMYRHPLKITTNQVELPAAFTPWILAQGVIQQPNVIFGGTFEQSYRDIRVVFEAPPLPPNPFLLRGMFSYKRKGDPVSPRPPDSSPPPPVPFDLMGKLTRPFGVS